MKVVFKIDYKQSSRVLEIQDYLLKMGVSKYIWQGEEPVGVMYKMNSFGNIEAYVDSGNLMLPRKVDAKSAVSGRVSDMLMYEKDNLQRIPHSKATLNYNPINLTITYEGDRETMRTGGFKALLDFIYSDAPGNPYKKTLSISDFSVENKLAVVEYIADEGDEMLKWWEGAAEKERIDWMEDAVLRLIRSGAGKPNLLGFNIVTGDGSDPRISSLYTHVVHHLAKTEGVDHFENVADFMLDRFPELVASRERLVSRLTKKLREAIRYRTDADLLEVKEVDGGWVITKEKLTVGDMTGIYSIYPREMFRTIFPSRDVAMDMCRRASITIFDQGGNPMIDDLLQLLDKTETYADMWSLELRMTDGLHGAYNDFAIKKRDPMVLNLLTV